MVSLCVCVVSVRRLFSVPLMIAESCIGTAVCAPDDAPSIKHQRANARRSLRMLTDVIAPHASRRRSKTDNPYEVQGKRASALGVRLASLAKTGPMALIQCLDFATDILVIAELYADGDSLWPIVASGFMAGCPSSIEHLRRTAASAPAGGSADLLQVACCESAAAVHNVRRLRRCADDVSATGRCGEAHAPHRCFLPHWTNRGDEPRLGGGGGLGDRRALVVPV